MGLWDKLKGELVDIVEWTDSSSDTMVYRFERYDNEIKYGAKLVVRESQMAVFVNEGQFADVFKPGMYTLETQNIPILTTLKGWKYGFSSPFKAEVYFVNTKNFTDKGWGTKNPIMLSDPRFGMVEIRAYGKYAMRVTDPKVFIKEIAGTDGQFTTDKIEEQLRSLVVTRFSDMVAESGIALEKYASNFDELSQLGQEKLGGGFGEYGLQITKFLVENISMPDEIKKEIFELSRLGAVDIAKLTQLKTAKAIEAAAANPGGTAGAGVGMGLGFGMAQQAMQSFGQGMAPPAAPPPLPGSGFFAAVNGQQSGPLTAPALQQMVSQGALTKETLVWKQGMAGWVAAGQVAELAGLFQGPPPLPK